MSVRLGQKELVVPWAGEERRSEGLSRELRLTLQQELIHEYCKDYRGVTINTDIPEELALTV